MLRWANAASTARCDGTVELAGLFFQTPLVFLKPLGFIPRFSRRDKL